MASKPAPESIFDGLTKAESEAIMLSPMFDMVMKNAGGKNYSVRDAWFMTVCAYRDGVVEASSKYDGIGFMTLEEKRDLQNITRPYIEHQLGIIAAESTAVAKRDDRDDKLTKNIDDEP